MTPRVVVHGGLAKTGTSAVQFWLQTHRDFLADHGVNYPDQLEQPVNGVSQGHLHNLLKPDGSGWFTLRTDQIEKMLAASAAAGQVLVLSSEYFYVWIPFLAEVLPAQTRYVVYVRDPASFLESAYNQEVKRGGATHLMPANPPDAGVGTQQLASVLSRVPGSADVVLRPYHSDLLVDRSILKDFLFTAGIDLPLPDEPATVNPSYTLAALEFKRTANHYPLADLAGRLDDALQTCTVGSTGYSLLTPTQFRAYRNYATAELNELIDGHGHRSLAPLRDLLPTQPQPPHHRQHATQAELHAVADHIRSHDPQAFMLLEQLVVQHPGVEVRYPGFPTFGD